MKASTREKRAKSHSLAWLHGKGPIRVKHAARPTMSVSRHGICTHKSHMKVRPEYPRNCQESGAPRLDAPPRNLSPVEASKRRCCNFLILAPLHLFLGRRKDNLNMAGVTLIRINTTMGAVCAATSFLLSRQVRFQAGRN
jgi:hypothetical protein